MRIKILKHPTEDDWMFAKQCALVTIGKSAKTPPNMEWKRKMLQARHSPIRELKFAFFLEGIPSWVSVHLVRHVHAQPFVKSQRNDRQDAYDRNVAPQSEPVDMIWTMNAEELMTIANKRLCGRAAKETREVVGAVCAEVLAVCPEFAGFLVPNCVYHGGECHEIDGGCGLSKNAWRKKYDG